MSNLTLPDSFRQFDYNTISFASDAESPRKELNMPFIYSKFLSINLGPLTHKQRASTALFHKLLIDPDCRVFFYAPFPSFLCIDRILKLLDTFFGHFLDILFRVNQFREIRSRITPRPKKPKTVGFDFSFDLLMFVGDTLTSI